ncbi:ferric reduction oxidase 8, mitochondrial [Euphorbia lathyris]|uniref:ferric reduction oxidase 8, mitochondrial n=1 Tax=Euphorbia lathyris TaxID=212925 RepID=UPI0033144D12
MMKNILRLFIILIFSGWVSIWLLKPTQFWTTKWKKAEDFMKPTILGYYGLDFAVYTFPIIALSIIGLVYLNLLSKDKPRIRQARTSTTGSSNPVIINSFIGILSGLEILSVFLFLVFLVWTFYARISNDFKKLLPAKSLNLNLWQLKYLRVTTRFGLLAEACLALLLLPILRGLALFQLVGVQFEASVRYHVWLGTSMILFATIHGVSTLFIWGVSHNIQDEIWRWQNMGRIYLAGEIALVIALVIWITSLPQIRRKKFEIFYYTHHLYIVFLVFFLFHAGDRHFYAVFPGVFLFGLDKLLRIVQSRPETCILSAKVFPNKAVELILPKDPSLKYTPTSVIYMKIPRISKFQWHSFSITSSSNIEDDVMSLLIKCEGDWTSSLYNMMQAELNSDCEHMICIPTSIEGPYGPPSLDFLRHDSLLLIAGGIGITPFLSIIKEIASFQSGNRYRFPTKIQLIYVVKKSQDICLLNSISSLLLNQSSKQSMNLNLKVFVTQEQTCNATLKELLNDLSLTKTVNFSTKCSKYAIHGLESPVLMAAFAALSSIVFLVFLTCFNHIFVASEKKINVSEKMVVRSEKKVAKEKTASSVVDLILLCSFIIAIICSTVLAIILRWKRLKKHIAERPAKVAESSSVLETRCGVEEHEIHFGGRPNFKDVLSKFGSENGGSDIGVLVCGPESMKESVASICQLKFQGLNVAAKGNKPYFSFHSLDFSF